MHASSQGNGYRVTECPLVVAGRHGVGKVFMNAPQLMLCKPSTNDRWDRRAVELAAYSYKFGDCNVSEVSSIHALSNHCGRLLNHQ